MYVTSITGITITGITGITGLPVLPDRRYRVTRSTTVVAFAGADFAEVPDMISESLFVCVVCRRPQPYSGIHGRSPTHWPNLATPRCSCGS